MNLFIPPFKTEKVDGQWTVKNARGTILGYYGTKKRAEDAMKQLTETYAFDWDV